MTQGFQKLDIKRFPDTVREVSGRQDVQSATHREDFIYQPSFLMELTAKFSAGVSLWVGIQD